MWFQILARKFYQKSQLPNITSAQYVQPEHRRSHTILFLQFYHDAWRKHSKTNLLLILHANKMHKIVNIIWCIRNAYNDATPGPERPAKLSNTTNTSNPSFFSSLLHGKSLYENIDCFIWRSKRTSRQDTNRRMFTQLILQTRSCQYLWKYQTTPMQTTPKYVCNLLQTI